MISNVKEVQSHLLVGLKYIHQLCIENNIDYYLIAGSALGAERHSGFIPWDDDVDLGLLRDDYNKLISLLIADKDPRYFLQDNSTETDYCLAYAKLRINNTIYKEKYYQHVDIHHGLSIDIFPFDKVGDNQFKSKLKYFFIKIIQVLILVKYANYNKRGMLYALAFFPLMLLSKNSLLRLSNRLIAGNNKLREFDFVVNFFGRYKFEKELVRVENFGSPKLLKFEDTFLHVPEKNREYLKNMYGDFMKIPPPHLRETHSPVEIKL
uniref:LicD family protein n=1 Tax=Polaribacter sp. TaxID=1920175 RepID=UPI0040483500